jgi:protein associated with RNAse G/E
MSWALTQNHYSWALLEEGQTFQDSRNIENFFYVLHGDIINVAALKDPVIDSLSHAQIERGNAFSLNEKWFDKVLLEKFLALGDYRDASGAPFKKEVLLPILETFNIQYNESQGKPKHITIVLIQFFSAEIHSTIEQLLTSEGVSAYDELWSHLKLCVCGLSYLNMLLAYSLCTEAFKKVADIRHAIPNQTSNAYNKNVVDEVYESIGNLCTSVSSSILRSNGKDEMSKLISRTKKTSGIIKFNL